MRLSRLALLLVLVTLSFARQSLAQTLTKQFTYQGYLENGGVPYTGTATVTFGLFSTLTGGVSRDSVTISNVAVEKGVFTVTINFGETDINGAQIYDGNPLYLNVVVNTGAGAVALTPRQPIQPAPYAITALGLPGVSAVNGSLGVGTTNPGARIHASGTGNGVLRGDSSSTIGTWLNLKNTSAGGRDFALISTGSANGEGAGKLLISDTTSGGPRMTLDSTGNVGIGTNAPAAKLQVIGTFRYSSDVNATLANSFDITSGAAIDLIGNNDVYMNARGGRKHILLNSDAGSGNVGIGTANPSEKLHVNGNIRAKVIIIEGGADLAESYDVAAAGDVKPMPGMVVSIDPDRVGKLRIATNSYDRTVAGIISGADGVAPGLVLGQKGTIADGTHPIANVGRVWCYVDADAGGPIVPGDMLTTSNTPGHAMKASDAARAGGATMGKAMSRLETGKGLVLVLVTLQ